MMMKKIVKNEYIINKIKIEKMLHEFVTTPLNERNSGICDCILI